MPFTSTEVLATAARSLAAAGARDRDNWVGLFTPDARVTDPVGSRPHYGAAEIGRFFDTFIGPRAVDFHPDVDLVSGSTVIRDGVLETALGSVGLTVPIYIRYDLREESGALKIAALSAFWELPTMVRQFLRSGAGGVPAGLALGAAMLRHQGIGGTAGFLGGFRGTGRQGKRRFGDLLQNALAGDEVGLRRRLTRDAVLTAGDADPISTSDLVGRLAGGTVHKMLAAGHQLAVGIDRDGGRDILFAEAAPTGGDIARIRHFAG
jgi:hypothetical protein